MFIEIIGNLVMYKVINLLTNNEQFMKSINEIIIQETIL